MTQKQPARLSIQALNHLETLLNTLFGLDLLLELRLNQLELFQQELICVYYTSGFLTCCTDYISIPVLQTNKRISQGQWN